MKLKTEEVTQLIADGVKRGFEASGLTKPERKLVHDDTETEPKGLEEAQGFWEARSAQLAPERLRQVEAALGFRRDAEGRRFDRATGERVERGAALGRFIRAMAALKRGILPASVAKALTEGTNTAGGFVVPPQYVAEIIPLLRTYAVVRASGARVIPLRQNLTQPRLSASGAANYIGENTVITVSQQTFEQFSLAVKKLAALVAVSNDLLRDADPAVDAIVRDDVVAAMALKQDLQFIRGTGSATAPTGVRNQTGIQTLTIGAGNGQTPTYDNLSDLLGLIETANVAFRSPGWIAHPRVLNTFRKIKDNDGRPILEQIWNAPQFAGPAGTDGEVTNPPRWVLLGYPLRVSAQIPVNLTVGTSTDTSEVYFADWDDAVIGQNMELAVDVSGEASFSDGGTNNVSAFANDLTLVRAIERHDFGLRHAAAFAVMLGVRP